MNNTVSTKEQRLRALKLTIEELLPEPMEQDTRILLWQFIELFTLKKRHDSTSGWWKRLYYKVLAVPLLVDGYVRDVRVNSLMGKFLFGNFARFGTLTATLKRVKKAVPTVDGFYKHPKYGFIETWRVKLAEQICEVLNDYHKGHC